MQNLFEEIKVPQTELENIVNEKLDMLTKKVLEKEKENIDLLNDIDDIRGLLVDMYL